MLAVCCCRHMLPCSRTAAAMARESTMRMTTRMAAPATTSSRLLLLLLLLLLPLLLLVQTGAAARITDLDDALLPLDILDDLHDEQESNRVRVDLHHRDESELLLVHVLFRHGDRTPDSPTYPTDPYSNYSYSPIGWGGLTPAGKRTEYRIGQFLKRRYGSFLGDYRSGLLYSRTTDWPRTKDSMALVLAGLFPPSRQDSWDDSLGAMWTPIASESTPREDDKLLYMWDAPCPAYSRQLKETLESPAFHKEFRTNHAATISYLEKYSGSKINTPEDVYNIYQALLAQKGFNLTLPAWAEEVFPEKIKPLTVLYFEVDSYNRKMQRLRAGPLLKRIIRQSVAKGRNLLRPVDRKMYLYAAHDNNVSALLRALRVWESSVPPYGTAVIAEVRRRAGRLGVQLFLRNSTSSDTLHALTMPECDHFCPMNRFIQLTADVIPSDWDAECVEE